MAEKQHGGDFLDKIQAHNRNVALEKQNELKRESLRVAKEERAAADRHRAEIKQLEKQRLAAEEENIRIAQEQQALQASIQEQNIKIHTASRQLKKLAELSTPGGKYLVIYEIKLLLNTINIDIVNDIEYRDRFSDTKDTIVKIKKDLAKELGERAQLLFSYDSIMERLPAICNGSGISDFVQEKEAKGLSESISKIQREFPELLIDASLLDRLTEHIDRFQHNIVLFAMLYHCLSDIKMPEASEIISKYFLSQYNLSDAICHEQGLGAFSTSIARGADWKELYKDFKLFLLNYKGADLLIQEIQKIFDTIARNANEESIDILAARKEQEQKALLVLALQEQEKKLTQITAIFNVCKGYPHPLEMETTQPDSYDKAIAATPNHEISIFGNRIQWHNIKTNEITTVLLDDFIKDAPTKLSAKTVVPRYENLVIPASYYDLLCLILNALSPENALKVSKKKPELKMSKINGIGCAVDILGVIILFIFWPVGIVILLVGLVMTSFIKKEQWK